MNKLSYKEWEKWNIENNWTVTEEQIESWKTQYYCGLNTYEEFKRLLKHEYKHYCNPSSMNYNNFQMYKRPMNVFEKLIVGWRHVLDNRWEWWYHLTEGPEEMNWEIWHYLNMDMVAYIEECYYTKNK